MQDYNTIIGSIQMRLNGCQTRSVMDRYKIGSGTLNLIMSRYHANGIPIEELRMMAPKKVEKAAKAVAKEVKQATSSVEEFAASLEGVALDRAQTFYDEGIRSVADFANWTEKELLALKGIGPATIKKLKELGVKFK